VLKTYNVSLFSDNANQQCFILQETCSASLYDLLEIFTVQPLSPFWTNMQQKA